MQSARLFSFNSVKFALVYKVEACAAFVENHPQPQCEEKYRDAGETLSQNPVYHIAAPF
jgi:hypothetical protein